MADRQNHAIRVVSGGQVYTLAGDGTPGQADGIKGASPEPGASEGDRLPKTPLSERRSV